MQDLLQLMYQDGHLSSTELDALRRTSRQLKENPVRVLRSLNVATPGEIKNLLQRYYGFAAATDKVIEEIDDSLRSLVPADLALHYCVLPVAEEKDEIFLLMEDPTDKGAIQQLEFFLDKRIVPVIATVQQLTNGFCRLYGVEPARLKLSGVLEASRGAVGVTTPMNIPNPQYIDDSQPLLDDEVFKKLKIKPKKKAVKRKNVAASSQEGAPAQIPSEVAPELAATLNVLGMKLSLARNRSEAVAMTNERLAEHKINLQLPESGNLVLLWENIIFEINPQSGKLPDKLPSQFKGIVKKIAQCPPA